LLPPLHVYDTEFVLPLMCIITAVHVIVDASVTHTTDRKKQLYCKTTEFNTADHTTGFQRPAVTCTHKRILS